MMDITKQIIWGKLAIFFGREHPVYNLICWCNLNDFFGKNIQFIILMIFYNQCRHLNDCDFLVCFGQSLFF
jgi:hypothetical protein